MEEEIALTRAEKRTNKAPPPPAPKTKFKAPPTNLLDRSGREESLPKSQKQISPTRRKQLQIRRRRPWGHCSRANRSDKDSTGRWDTHPRETCHIRTQGRSRKEQIPIETTKLASIQAHMWPSKTRNNPIRDGE